MFDTEFGFPVPLIVMYSPFSVSGWFFVSRVCVLVMCVSYSASETLVRGVMASGQVFYIHHPRIVLFRGFGGSRVPMHFLFTVYVV